MNWFEKITIWYFIYGQKTHVTKQLLQISEAYPSYPTYVVRLLVEKQLIYCGAAEVLSKFDTQDFWIFKMIKSLIL